MGGNLGNNERKTTRYTSIRENDGEYNGEDRLGPPLETAARREASPPGPPLAKKCPLVPPSRNGFQTFPKQGGRRGLELKAPEADVLEPEALELETEA